MRALVLKQDSFRIEEIDRPSMGPSQCLVKVHYAALNHRDQWIREGQYAKIQLPAVLGSDGVGIVEEVGNKAEEKWLGKAVIINPNIDWGRDNRFQAKEYQILGMPSFGTLAEYIVVDMDRLYEQPDYLPMEEAAALPLAGLTAYNALFNKGKVQKGMNVLISGVGGGVAQFAFLFSIAVGANTYITSSKDSVIQHCIGLGAKGGINYTQTNAVKDLAKSIGNFDLIIDSACGDGMNELLAALKPAGKFVFYGATRGLPKDLNMRLIFWNHLQLLGSTMGSDEDFFKMLDFCREHKIHPILDRVYNLDDAVAAFDRMKGNEQFGKIVVEI